MDLKYIAEPVLPLRVFDGQLCSLSEQDIRPACLRGMSMFWSQWNKHLWTDHTLDNLNKRWGCNLVRVPIGHTPEHKNIGYVFDYHYEFNSAINFINKILSRGMYAIVDVHNHEAWNNESESLRLLEGLSTYYGDHPGVIYEVINEPLNCSWRTIKDYAQKAIKTVRQSAPSAVCLVGTPDWCTNLMKPMWDPITGVDNIMYTYHFYAGTHQEKHRADLSRALSLGFPVFVSECGVSEANGDGTVNYLEFDKWLGIFENKNISWCAWALHDKMEKSSSLVPSNQDHWEEEHITDTGLFYRDRISNFKNYGKVLPCGSFFESPFDGRIDETIEMDAISKRQVPFPVHLIRSVLSDILNKAGVPEYDIFLLWMAMNYRSLDLDLKKDIQETLSEISLNAKDYPPEQKWALYRLRETVISYSSSGRV